MLENSDLGLLGKNCEGLARALDSLFATNSAGEELTGLHDAVVIKSHF